MTWSLGFLARIKLPKEHPERADRTAQIGLALPIDFSHLLAGAPKIALKRGQGLFEIGDSVECCYWLDAGALKVCLASFHGQERIFAVLGSGSIVGGFAIIDGLPRFTSVHALSDSNLSCISRSAFLECLRKSPDLYAYLIKMLLARLRQAEEEVAASSFLPIKARIARSLLKLAEHVGKPTLTPDHVRMRHLRQSDVAALAHVARENVSRILSEWTKRKLIHRVSASDYIILKSGIEREAEQS